MIASLDSTSWEQESEVEEVKEPVVSVVNGGKSVKDPINLLDAQVTVENGKATVDEPDPLKSGENIYTVTGSYYPRVVKLTFTVTFLPEEPPVSTMPH